MYEYGVLESKIVELLESCLASDANPDATKNKAAEIYSYCKEHQQETHDVIANLQDYLPDLENDIKSKVDKITITIEQLKSGKKTTINI